MPFKCAFFTSMNINFTFSAPLAPTCPAAIRNSIFFASSGGMAAKRSSLSFSPFGLKSRATNRHLTSGRSAVPLFTSTHFVETGDLPVSFQHSSTGTSSYKPIRFMNSTSSVLASFTSVASKASPVRSSRNSSHHGVSSSFTSKPPIVIFFDGRPPSGWSSSSRGLLSAPSSDGACVRRLAASLSAASSKPRLRSSGLSPDPLLRSLPAMGASAPAWLAASGGLAGEVPPLGPGPGSGAGPSDRAFFWI